MSEKIDEIESFEDKVKKLEDLLDKLKDENLSLEKSVEIYKEALSLLKQTSKILDKAKLEITEISDE
ncbi:exodeoxyribonuclease VII small subunit [Campylobacter ureolyticus]|uniref:exodeoxyribonuclease VII small subunit n=1 Tax=Campylobacter ureolyticus TaxID=827 RepID=UPI0022B49BB7|nr:exodeoxyribonuclease VII small subunit [Campylobacter ureolyticus]MCZ6111067.1 exodeoxyribonuclease VII small subunit [Campylobacter ureolyticus]MDK8322525.1 exodeoxyribonuclease VII small subunit [Campylobacter ureolyticus]